MKRRNLLGIYFPLEGRPNGRSINIRGKSCSHTTRFGIVRFVGAAFEPAMVLRFGRVGGLELAVRRSFVEKMPGAGFQ